LVSIYGFLSVKIKGEIMKVYLKRVITGSVFVLALFILMGARQKADKNNNLVRYELHSDADHSHLLFDTFTGSIYKLSEDQDSRGAYNWDELVGFIEL
tara:strand:+ start:221 stop:514 length:294 start_codon:yes stop_codon:yes gene_type:complete